MIKSRFMLPVIFLAMICLYNNIIKCFTYNKDITILKSSDVFDYKIKNNNESYIIQIAFSSFPHETNEADQRRVVLINILDENEKSLDHNFFINHYLKKSDKKILTSSFLMDSSKNDIVDNINNIRNSINKLSKTDNQLLITALNNSTQLASKATATILFSPPSNEESLKTSREINEIKFSENLDPAFAKMEKLITNFLLHGTSPVTFSNIFSAYRPHILTLATLFIAITLLKYRQSIMSKLHFSSILKK